MTTEFFFNISKQNNHPYDLSEVKDLEVEYHDKGADYRNFTVFKTDEEIGNIGHFFTDNKDNAAGYGIYLYQAFCCERG